MAGSVVKIAGKTLGLYMLFNGACGGIAMYNGNFQNPGEDFGHGFVYGHNVIVDFVGDAAKTVGGAAYDAVIGDP